MKECWEGNGRGQWNKKECLEGDGRGRHERGYYSRKVVDEARGGGDVT